MYLFIIFLSVILWNFALIFGHIPHGRPSVGGSGALLIQKKLDSQRSASQRTLTQQISMRRTGPRTNSSKSRIGAGGGEKPGPSPTLRSRPARSHTAVSHTAGRCTSEDTDNGCCSHTHHRFGNAEVHCHTPGLWYWKEKGKQKTNTHTGYTQTSMNTSMIT